MLWDGGGGGWEVRDVPPLEEVETPGVSTVLESSGWVVTGAKGVVFPQ